MPMARDGKRLIAVFAAAALIAMLLVACGGSDSSSSGGSTSAEAGAENDADAGATENESQEEQADAEEGSTGFTREEIETPLEVSGGGSEQFLVKGGDNSIQEYGEEADESELQEAAEVVHSFFVARAEGDWARACAYLSKSMQEQLEQLATSSTELADKDCAPFLEAFTTHLSASAWREITTVDAGSLRRDDEGAFLIYYGADKAAYAIPLADENGELKVGGLSGNPLG